ncbi:MAG TPA: glycosyltransferase family 2 protein [Anaerolineales bacterium]|nr:glycosyltransferase family 2 protein [Anaerolineales bacterium]
MLSVVIPAYNERERLGQGLAEVLAFLNRHTPDFELIIVDDGSQDGMADVVRAAIALEPRARLITYKANRGKGYAVRTGVLDSHGDPVIFMDADLSTPLSEIPRILERLAVSGADIVIGSRGLPEADIRQKPPLGRRIASRIFDEIKHALVGLRGLHDTQCGFKAFRGNVARRLFDLSRVDRFMFDVEILYLAERAGLSIVEFPVAWADMPGSKVRFLEGVINMFRDLWRIRRMHPGEIVVERENSRRATDEERQASGITRQ